VREVWSVVNQQPDITEMLNSCAVFSELYANSPRFFDVLLTVYLSKFILVFNQIDA